MRLQQCEKCAHLRAADAVCERKGVPIAKIRGCSLCPSGKMFFRVRHMKEAICLRVTGKKKGDAK